jgi:5-formyltetrahydrofolate cyclo-ligase
MTTIEQKKALRKAMLEKRRGVDTIIKKEYDNWICLELENLIVKRNCKIVHAYIPFSTEIDISPLLKKLLELKVTVICPKTLPKRKLENRVLYSLEDVEVGIMGTKHPLQTDVYEGPLDFIIVPGLAFDKAKYRVGYGGGYYDNFLVSQSDSYKVGVFYSFQQFDVVPVESHDISLDAILVKEF